MLHVAGQLRPVVTAVSSALAVWTAAETAGEDWLVPDPDNLTHATIAPFERAARWAAPAERE